MSIKEDVLHLLKVSQPLSVPQIARRLSLDQKQVRGGIDRLRVMGEPVWNDRSQGLFWWADDHPVGHGWQRTWTGSKVVR